MRKIVAITIILLQLYRGWGQTPDTTGVDAMRGQATAHLLGGRFTEALDLFQKAVGQYAAVGHTDAQARCQTNIGLIYYYLSKPDESESAHRQAIRLIEHKQRTDPVDLPVRIYINYCALLYSQNQYEAAIETYEKALQAAIRLCPPNDPMFGHIYNGFASASIVLNRYSEAEQYYKQALDAYERSGAGMKVAYIAHANLGALYKDFADFDRALGHLTQVENWLNSASEIPFSVETEKIYFSIGKIFHDTGEYGKALGYYQKAADITIKRFGPSNALLADIYGNMGSILRQQERYDEALKCFQNGLAISDANKTAAAGARIFLLSNLSASYAEQKKEKESDQVIEKALLEARSLDKPNEIASVYNFIASNRLDQERYDEAARHYLHAASILKEEYGPNHWELPVYYAFAASALNHLERFDEALPLLAEAIRITALPGARLDALGNPPDSAFRLTRQSHVILNEKAKALLGKYKQSSGDATLLEAARASNNLAIALDKRFRQRYQSARDESGEWRTRPHSIYVVGVEINRQQYLLTKDPAFLESAFHLADQSRAAHILESAQNAEAKLFADVSPEWLEKESDLSRRISFYESKIFETGHTVYYDSLLFSLKQEQERLIRFMEREYPRYFELRYRIPTARASEIAQTLDPNSIFLEYLMDPDQKRLYIFTIDQTKGLQLAAAPLADSTLANIRELHALSQSVWLHRSDKRARFVELSHALYQQLLTPVEDRLKDKTKLIVAGESELHYLPFELLLRSPEIKPYQSLDYLVRRFDVAYQYSGAWLVRNAQKISPPASGILSFAPVFERNDATQPLADLNRESAAEEGRGGFTPLPYSEQEAQTIAKLFEHKNTALLLSDHANESALKAELQKPRRFIHIAGHSFANTSQPKFSGIACAPGSADGEDGILYVNEIYNLKIPADLVVLSSCESGLGKLRKGEGLLGLNHAFAYAGAPNAVYTLWKVNDKTGSELMIEFYRQILSGKTYAAALRVAKLKMLENPATASPNLWGGFLLSGR